VKFTGLGDEVTREDLKVECVLCCVCVCVCLCVCVYMCVVCI